MCAHPGVCDVALGADVAGAVTGGCDATAVTAVARAVDACATDVVAPAALALCREELRVASADDSAVGVAFRDSAAIALAAAGAAAGGAAAGGVVVE